METELQEKSITLDEIIINPEFISFVESGIRELKSRRYDRPKPKPGFHYKKDWYDRMSNNQTLDAHFFIENIKDVWFKESSLNSETRHVMLIICNSALNQTIISLNK